MMHKWQLVLSDTSPFREAEDSFRIYEIFMIIEQVDSKDDVLMKYKDDSSDVKIINRFPFWSETYLIDEIEPEINVDIPLFLNADIGNLRSTNELYDMIIGIDST